MKRERIWPILQINHLLGPSLALFLFSWSLSCQPVKITPDNKKQQSVSGDAQADNTKTDGDRDERVDPPQNIIGHYLHCAFEIEASDAQPEALVGCRLDQPNGQRTPAASFGSSYQYTAGPTPDQKVTVYGKNLANDLRYDAAFLFLGPDRASILEAARASMIRVRIRDSRATGNDLLLGTALREAERSPTIFPEPRGDYNRVRNEILSDSQLGNNALPANP